MKSKSSRLKFRLLNILVFQCMEAIFSPSTQPGRPAHNSATHHRTLRLSGVLQGCVSPVSVTNHLHNLTELHKTQQHTTEPQGCVQPGGVLQGFVFRSSRLRRGSPVILRRISKDTIEIPHKYILHIHRKIKPLQSADRKRYRGKRQVQNFDKHWSSPIMVSNVTTWVWCHNDRGLAVRHVEKQLEGSVPVKIQANLRNRTDVLFDKIVQVTSYLQQCLQTPNLPNPSGHTSQWWRHY